MTLRHSFPFYCRSRLFEYNEFDLLEWKYLTAIFLVNSLENILEEAGDYAYRVIDMKIDMDRIDIERIIDSDS